MFLSVSLLVVSVSEHWFSWAHPIATERTQLIERMEALASCFFRVVVVVLITELVVLKIFLHQVRFLHDGVTNRDIGVGKWHMVKCITIVPEIHRQFEGID